jgi:hypothetical protein
MKRIRNNIKEDGAKIDAHVKEIRKNDKEMEANFRKKLEMNEFNKKILQLEMV